MKRGPLGKSPELVRLEGNVGRRRLRPPPPKLDDAPVDLAPPKHLSGVAKREWRRLYEPLRRAGLMTLADVGAFELYVAAFARMRAAEQEFAVASGDSRLKLFRVCRQCAADLRAAMQDFGLTAPSRLRLEAAAPPKPPAIDGVDGSEIRGFEGLIGRQKP